MHKLLLLATGVPPNMFGEFQRCSPQQVGQVTEPEAVHEVHIVKTVVHKVL